MRKSTFSFTLILGLSLFFFSCAIIFSDQIKIRGNGKIIRKERSIPDITGVTMRGSGDLFIRQGMRQSLIIECDENIESRILTTVRGDQLDIGPREKERLKASERIKYTLFIKKIKNIDIDGWVNVKSDGIKTDRLHITVGGAGKIRFKALNADQVIYDIDGYGRVEVASGCVPHQDISISGMSKMFLSHLKSEIIDIDISGYGKSRVWATKMLKVDIGGMGKVFYVGTPETLVDISGIGKVEEMKTLQGIEKDKASFARSPKEK